MSNNEFQVGNQVVYPSHGVGKITGEETQTVAGTNIKLYVIKFDKDQMTLKVPVNRAETAGLRTLSGQDILKDVTSILKGRSKPGRGMWSRRAQEYENKINSGDPILVAEVIRDLHKNVDDPDRSYSERVIYESALNRLAGEFAAVRASSIDSAIKEITDILRAKRKRAANDEKAINDNEESSVEAA